MEKQDLNRLVNNNQTIKIVPSIEDFLRTIGLNVDLNENDKYWFDQLEKLWKTWKKSATIENHIEMFFKSRPDPYRVALIFIIKCKDFKDCKPKTLPYFIIEILEKLFQTNGIFPEDTLKLPAFHISIQQRNQQFLNLILKTYRVVTIKQVILPIVKDMIKNDNCKQASQIIIALELFEDIAVEDLLFPFILQDKTNMIDEYLTECPKQVEPLLLFLDKLLDRNFNTHEYIQQYINENKICHVKYDKIHYKPLGKLVARLCNKFKVPIETCKNLSKNRTTGGLRYLIYQKYIQHNVSSSVWDDLVKDSLQQNTESGKEFINMLLEYDKKEALRWVRYLNIPDHELPLALKEISLAEDSVSENEENWDTDVNQPLQHYKLNLPEDKIIIIDTAEKFYDLINSLLECNIVSIDCEWKPSFGASQLQVALIQVATHNNVYLIDTLVLNKKQYTSFWSSFYKSLLDNAEIIKIGFGLEQDLKEIKASVIGLGNIKVKGEGLLDLGLLWKYLLNNGLTMAGNSDIGGNSLSALVQSCFGLPLEKSEQCSNWELRPLRSTQIQYAALDAYVLVQIYYFLEKKCNEQGINFEEICNDVMLDNKKRKQTKKIKVADIIQSSISKLKSKTVDDVKFLVEPKLSQLVAYLRYCGIDTTIMSTGMLWHDIINLAISEERFILETKMKCTPNHNFPQSSILNVGKGDIKEQLNKILTAYNIVVQQNDILSRCVYCNGKSLKKLESNEVYNVCTSVNQWNYETQSYDEDEQDLYSGFSDEDYDEDLPGAKIFEHVPIEIDVSNKSLPNMTGVQCLTCGKLLWDEDYLIKSVSSIVLNLIKICI